MMASDDKKIKTNPAPKNEAPPKNKSTSGVDPSKAEGGGIAAALPSVIAGARARNRFLKLIGITGTRFSRRKKSDNSSNGAGVAVARRGQPAFPR
jgi:hypothetical protein